MKYSLLVLICFFSVSAYAVRDLEIPLEMDSFQIEYRDISKTGIIRVDNCKRCTQKIYEFDENIEIKKDGNVITLKSFLDEYWKVKYPTIFLKTNDNKAVRIVY